MFVTGNCNTCHFTPLLHKMSSYAKRQDWPRWTEAWIMKEQHKQGKNSSCKGIKKCWGSHKRWVDRNIFLPQTRIRTDWGNTVFLSVYIKQNVESKYRLCNKELRPHALLCRSTVSQSGLRLCKDEISIYRATFQNRIISDKLAQNCIS